jgi:hypothetical protein
VCICTPLRVQFGLTKNDDSAFRSKYVQSMGNMYLVLVRGPVHRDGLDGEGVFTAGQGGAGGPLQLRMYIY